MPITICTIAMPVPISIPSMISAAQRRQKPAWIAAPGGNAAARPSPESASASGISASGAVRITVAPVSNGSSTHGAGGGDFVAAEASASKSR